MEKIIRDSFLPSNRTVGMGMILTFYDFLRRFSILLIPSGSISNSVMAGMRFPEADGPDSERMTELQKYVNEEINEIR